MSLNVTVHVKQERWKALLRPYSKTIEAACEAAIASSTLGRRACQFEMSVVLTDDQSIRELNRDYRGQDKATNVLSFPRDEAIEKNIASLTRGVKEYYIGDVVLAMETLEREAKEQGKSFKAHATHLLLHGTLHLLGHDHMKAKEAEKMEVLEIKILKKLKISNPYL